MRKVFLLFVMFLGLRTSILHAQNLLQNGDFQNSYSCCNTASNLTGYPNACNGGSNCLNGSATATGWVAAAGYPTMMWEGDNPATISNGNTNYYVELGWVQAVTSCQLAYNNVSFNANSHYTFTYKRRGTMPVGSSYSIFIDSGYYNNSTSTTSQLLLTETFTSIPSWQTNSFTFTANQNYIRLIFVMSLPNVTVDVDDIVITSSSSDNSCCSPYKTYTSADLPLPGFDKRAIYITTSGNGVLVSPGAYASFQAGQYIQLNPGFETQANSSFLAYIAPCTTTSPTIDAGPDKYICMNEPCPRSAGHAQSIGTASQAGFTYNWSPSTYLNSSTVSNPVICIPYVSGATAGVQYTYTLSASNGCGSASDQMVVTTQLCEEVGRLSDLTDLNESEVNKFNYYPNPTTGKIRLEIPTEASSVNVTINDLRGTKIYESNMTGSQEIDLSGRESGLYILKTNIDGEVKIQKIILNK